MSDRLTQLWIEAGRPVEDGMSNAKGAVIVGELSDYGAGKVVIARRGCHPPMVRTLLVLWGPPDFADRKNEVLFMHLAEKAVGCRLCWLRYSTEADGEAGRNDPWGADAHDGEGLPPEETFCPAGPTYPERIELALRVIIAAKAHKAEGDA